MMSSSRKNDHAVNIYTVRPEKMEVAAIKDLNLNLSNEIIEKIKVEVTEEIKEIMFPDLIQIILYGSCARGDYHADSDVDIALLTKCDRHEAKKYDHALAKIATELAMKYFAVVNFVPLPYDEFLEKKAWYAYFKNIDQEGEVLYG